jgi:hypothetical protein
VESHVRSVWDEFSLLLLWENRKAQDLGFWSEPWQKIIFFANVRDHRWLPVARLVPGEERAQARGVTRVAIRWIALFGFLSIRNKVIAASASKIGYPKYAGDTSKEAWPRSYTNHWCFDLQTIFCMV